MNMVSKDVKDQLTGGCLGVDAIFRNVQPDVFVLKIFNYFQEFFEWTPKPIQAGDDQLSPARA